VPEAEKALFDSITGYDELTPIVSCVSDTCDTAQKAEEKRGLWFSLAGGITCD